MTEVLKITTDGNRTIDWRIIAMLIIAITVLESIALVRGINGSILSLVLMILAGFGGLMIPNPFNIKK